MFCDGIGGKLWKKIIDDLQFLLKVDDVLFVHAGIDPDWLEQINEQHGIRDITALNNFLIAELKKNPWSHILNSANSPIWTRRLAMESDEIVCDVLLPKIFKFFKVFKKNKKINIIFLNLN